MAELWDQQQDENRVAYMQFLTYRNLGPTRTIDGAYRAYLKDFALSEKVPERAPGNWREASSEFQWKHRAEAFDLWRLCTYGNRAAVFYTYAVEKMAEKLARAVDLADETDLGTKQWRAVLETLDRVSAQLSAARKVGALGLEAPPGETPNVGTDAPPKKPRILVPADPVE